MAKFNLSSQLLVYSAKKSVDRIQSINMDIMFGDIQVVSYDKSELSVEVYLEKPNQYPRYRVDVVQNVDTIQIELKKGNLFFDTFSLVHVCVVVSIPKSYCNRLNISGTTANLQMNDIKVSELRTKLVTGITSFELVDADSISVDSVTGNVNLKELTTNGLFINSKTGAMNVQNVHLRHPQAYNTIINVATLSGKLDMSVRDCYDKIYVNATTGGITLNLPSDYRFSSNCNSVAGKVKMHSGYNSIADVNNGRQNEVVVSAVTGSINIYQ
ncbi:DUF4097 family beta strand repeat-containing protein [Paludicola sp. MB14-C6]|uniref:DUF4097 family beta strand repeat-containing protein n=1 Tax=Paludihabitans sp. MB14-C6 TaxID=3070656 RepID=UPI0027DC04A3|nr:DUF4097 family beta strand repeat-containing protein [Paludicola sp. MB14-C6]WMJ24352.1 DUF4097 family beta strand repeat-containing protein [Paludicola sp. MB14-C6]